MRTKVPTTLGAHDLDPRHAERGVFVSKNSTGQGIEERRPPTARVELRIRAALTIVSGCSGSRTTGTMADLPEEGSVATGTSIDALFMVLVVLACAGPLSALLPQHSELHEAKKMAVRCIQERSHKQQYLLCAELRLPL